MKTESISNRLIELCTEGKFLEAQIELYDKNILSIEVDGTKTISAAKMHEKERRFLNSVVKFHNIEFSEPLIAGNYFSVVLKMEVELKNIGLKNIQEICVYKVKDNKIVFEQFFRD